jgi:hypothetical protein
MHKFYRQLTADRRKLGVIVVLLLIGIVMWGRLLLDTGPSEAKAKPADAITQPLPDPGTLSVAPDAATQDQPVVRLARPRPLSRDLFNTAMLIPRKKVEPEPKSPDEPSDAPKEVVNPGVLNLQSVMQGADGRAMINGTIVPVGGTIQGFELKQVADRSVIVEKAGQTFRLTL